MGCDAGCAAQLTSARSALGIVGSVLVGKLADLRGRRLGLWVSFIGQCFSSLAFVIGGSSLSMYVGLYAVGSLLSKLYDVAKAILADLTEGKPVHERSGKQGMLGMAAGVGILGSGIGGALGGAREVSIVTVVCTIVALCLVSSISLPPHKRREASPGQSESAAVWAMLSVPCARTP